MNNKLTDTQKTYIRGWVDALRSGKYKQGRGRLRSLDDKFCCLGVLCDLGDQKAWVQGESSFCYRDFCSLLPTTVRDIVGLTDFDLTALMKLNDSQGKSFEEIANYIEMTFLND